MPNLEQLITEWRKTMTTGRFVGRETLDELENHLRENVDELARAGMPEAEAFQRAIAQLGSPPKIASEFQKLNEVTWLPVKVLTGTSILAAILWVICFAIVFARSDKFQSDLLLASHVFVITIGYTTVFFAGALGICFVCQRCFSDFSSSHAQSIRRAVMIFSSAAAILTMAGTVLGSIWTKGAWGRHWTWDLQETGALCVVVWMVFLACAYRVRSMSDHGILLSSILGNIIVSLAWFGASLWLKSGYGLHHDLLSWVFLALVSSNLAAFLIGLGPAGWLRLRKA